MSVRILVGDCRQTLATLPSESVQTCVTSPPYFGLRDYGTATWEGGDPTCEHAGRVKPRHNTSGGAGARFNDDRGGQPSKVYIEPVRDTCACGARRIDAQIGLESTPDAFVAEMVAVFREVRRVLRDDGTLWLNLGDSYSGSGKGAFGSREAAEANRHRIKEVYIPTREESPLAGVVPAGLKPKDLIGIPWRVAFALQQPWLLCAGCGQEHHASGWATFQNGRRICPACEKSCGVSITEPGWYLRQDIIWAKPNPMPESVTDRCTKSHEYLFLLSKKPRYYFDSEAISEAISEASIARLSQPTLEQQVGSDRVPGKTNGNMKAVVKRSGNKERKPASARGVPVDTNGDTNGAAAGSIPWEGTTRNKRSVWTVTTQPFKGAHFATFPPALIEPCILAGCPKGATVLDPFGGAGTTGLVSDRLGRDAILCELNPAYAAMAEERIRSELPMFAEVEVITA